MSRSLGCAEETDGCQAGQGGVGITAPRGRSWEQVVARGKGGRSQARATR